MLIENDNMFDISEEEYVDEQEVQNNYVRKEIMQAPEVGMQFDSFDTLFEYYKQYGKQEGFGIIRQSLRSQGDLNGLFDVVEDVMIGERYKKVHFNVYCNEVENEVKCACRLFEFRGILCKHTLSVLKLDKQKVSEKYILARWRKDLKRIHTKVKVTYDDWKGGHEAQRYYKLQKKLSDVADLAVLSDENCTLLCNMMDEFHSKISENESALRSCPLTNTNASIEFVKASRESNGLRSPIVVRRHGRPPKNRKVSNVEKFVSKKKKLEDKKNKKKMEKPELQSQAIEQDVCIPVGICTQESTSIQERQLFTSDVFHVNNVARIEQHAPCFHYFPPYTSRPLDLPNSLLNAQGYAIHYSNPYMQQEDDI